MINIYYNNFEIDLKKWKIQIWFVQTFTTTFKYCPGFGWNVQAIDLNLTIRHSMMQCFKTILLDFCRAHIPWTLDNSKYFEFCERSQYKPTEQVKIAFSTQNLQKKLDDQLWAGTVDPESKVYCVNFFGLDYDIPGFT